MQAFHGDHELKTHAIATVRRHMQRGHMRAGIFWSADGVTQNNHSAIRLYAESFGLPLDLALLQIKLFVAAGHNENREGFPLEVMEAITVGSDLGGVARVVDEMAEVALKDCDLAENIPDQVSPSAPEAWQEAFRRTRHVDRVLDAYLNCRDHFAADVFIHWFERGVLAAIRDAPLPPKRVTAAVSIRCPSSSSGGQNVGISQ